MTIVKAKDGNGKEFFIIQNEFDYGNDNKSTHYFNGSFMKFNSFGANYPPPIGWTNLLHIASRFSSVEEAKIAFNEFDSELQEHNREMEVTLLEEVETYETQ